MDTHKKIEKLEGEIRKLKYQVLILSNVIFTEPSAWAAESLNKAFLCGLKPSPYGESLDMCRIVNLLDNMGLFSKKGE